MIAQRTRDAIASDSVCIRDIFEIGIEMAKEYGEENVFNFTIGNPSVEPPKEVNEGYIEALKIQPATAIHGYPVNTGWPDVRQFIADKLSREFNANYEMKGITMTGGCGQALSVTMYALLDQGDDVVTFAPYFWEYRNYASVFYANFRTAQCNMETLQPDPVTFEAALTPKTKMVIINSPNNPTGAVYTEESIKMIADIMRRKSMEYGHPIYLVADEPYRKLCYEGTVPFLPDYYKNTIVCYSFSKTLSIPGDRIGYIAVLPSCEGYEELLTGFKFGIRYMGIVNAPSVPQKMIVHAYDVTSDMSIYKKTRDVLYDNLTKIGYTCVHPDGAFYLFLKALEPDDVAFCMKAREFKILMAPGTAFGGPGWVRIAYPVPAEKAERSIPAFEQLFKAYQK